MAHSHCTGPGPGTMGFFITLYTVQTAQGQGHRQGTIVFYSVCPRIPINVF